MQTPNRTSWADILLVIIGLLGLLGYWGLALLMFISGLIGLAGPVSSADSTQAIVLGIMFGFNGLFLFPGLWMTFRRMSGRFEPDGEARYPFALWHIPLILLVWAAGLFGGRWASSAPSPAWILLAVFGPLSVLPPIWFLVGMAARGYNTRPLWRSWNTFSIGLTLGPFLILVVEIFALAVLVVAAIVFIAVQPDLMAELETLAFRVQIAQDEEEILRALGPLVANPGFIGLVMLALSVVVPLIEELLKPIAVWLFSRQLRSRWEGFVLGALSGGAYALFETSGVSPAAGMDWLELLGARGGTSLLHIATSAWMGSAIVPAIRERKWGLFFGVYGMAILLHGVWNALSILNGFGPAAVGQPGGGWIVIIGRFSAYGLGALALVFTALIIHQHGRFKSEHEQMFPVVAAPVVSAVPSIEPEPTETVIR